MKYKVYYDYHEGELVPIWFVISLDGIYWSDDYLYVPIEAPFESFPVDEFDENIMSFSILMSDLTRVYDKTNEFGIYLPYVKQRVLEYGIDVTEIEQFIIQVADVEDVLQMSIIRDFIRRGEQT
ncbi:hypothetical protein L1765_10210 [Microaerobacter geothermalis]|uniref:hypothetical protein n=1 Tax=Microaerobacter geothermalis TaxID=674972 RepID=UPI001F3F802C|nr:hypothetical protein [Microaerobacter geothermalis]MCF6094336.1 hypothetical protein [Microaerobacter geothermalis]